MQELQIEQGNMGESKNTTRIVSDIRFFFSAVIVFVLFILILVAVVHRNDALNSEAVTDYSRGWSYEGGAPVNLDALQAGKQVTIHKVLDDEVVEDRSLCFYTKNLYFTVFMDGEVIHDFHPNAPAILGRTYGIFPHTVNLPVLYKDATLTIRIDHVYDDNPGFIRDMSLDDGTRFLLVTFQTSAVDFLLCLVVFGFGVVLFILGIVGRYFNENRFEIISVGTFAMVAALWVISETTILPVITGSPVAVHFMDYIALDLLGLPGLMFVTAVVGRRKTHLVLISGILTAAKITFSILSTINGWKDYHELLPLTHVLLGLTVVVVFYLVIVAMIQRTIRGRLVKLFLIALLFSLAMGVVDITRYVMDPHAYLKASYYKYALFFFIFVCGVYEISLISDLSRRGRYAEAMEEMAYKDGLTGLLNRMAFKREIQKAAKKKSNGTLIMLDMNDLKRVNDELGHDQGDSYIIKIAECMNKAFTHGEKCFRFGGDEFLVLSKYTNEDPIFRESMKILKAEVERFNRETGSAIPLSIAYGHAEYDPGKVIEDQVRVADQRMYKMKAEMKAEGAG